uniref:Neugrin n=1 Tax=Cairina moschata TaxID=8855 RepID=A0A8C3BQX3_CAIMO
MAALLRRGLRAAALLAGAPRRAAAAWPGDPEPPDAALEEAERCGAAGPGPGRDRDRGRGDPAARLQRLRRELGEGRGAPERTLSWQAMEQMRFLRRELPEEWPLQRLAQGFGVSPDVVRRVLRGRGCPPPHRRLRQDARALRAAASPRPPGPAPHSGSTGGGGRGHGAARAGGGGRQELRAGTGLPRAQRLRLGHGSVPASGPAGCPRGARGRGGGSGGSGAGSEQRALPGPCPPLGAALRRLLGERGPEEP